MADFFFAACEYKFCDEVVPGQFEGYASTFTVDQGGDLIRPGAFTKTLQLDPTPKMYLNHAGMPWKTTTAEDMIPIGVWKACAEDQNGLAVKGQLADLTTDRGRMIHAAMKDGRLGGLSIGYKATRVTRGSKAGQPVRTIHECKLHEISVVSDPMNAACTVSQVKAMMDGFNPRDVEAALRDAGLSRADAVKSVAILRDYLRRDGEVTTAERRDDAGAAELVAAIKRAASTLTTARR